MRHAPPVLGTLLLALAACGGTVRAYELAATTEREGKALFHAARTFDLGGPAGASAEERDAAWTAFRQGEPLPPGWSLPPCAKTLEAVLHAQEGGQPRVHLAVRTARDVREVEVFAAGAPVARASRSAGDFHETAEGCLETTLVFPLADPERWDLRIEVSESRCVWTFSQAWDGGRKDSSSSTHCRSWLGALADRLQVAFGL